MGRCPICGEEHRACTSPGYVPPFDPVDLDNPDTDLEEQ